MTNQLSFDDFYFPYGKLSADNRWVNMAASVPWGEVERDYSKGFVNNGAPAHPARVALGSLIIKQVLGCSDEELVCQVAENPYLQFFIGLKAYQDECPFGASTLVAFRKRSTEDGISRINESMLASAGRGGAGGDDDGSGNPGDGGSAGGRTMALDATVAPSGIAYPQDMMLLNAAREGSEAVIDGICAQSGAPKPRMCRNVARRDYLSWPKPKRRTAKKARKAIRRQLGHVARGLGYVESPMDAYAPDIGSRRLGRIEAIKGLYAQQPYMHQSRARSVPGRIVSLSQPWARPVVRGKANASTEFGAKLHISCDDEGFARIDGLSFDPFNESERLIPAADAYRGRKGCCPDRILADQIYRNRKNLAWCKEEGIRLSGPKLGRPAKDAEATRGQKAAERKGSAGRNVVEGVFGTAKTAYGLGPVKARLEGATRVVIALAILAFNLKKLPAASSSSVAGLLESAYRTVARLLSSCLCGIRLSFRPVME